MCAQAQRQEAVDLWILQGQTEEAYKRNLVSTGEQKIVGIKRTLASGDQALTNDQEARLKLSIQGTASRFVHEIASMRAATAGVDINNAQDQQKAIQILQPLMQRVQQGLYNDNSLFERTLDHVLSKPQQELIAKKQQEALDRRNHAITLKFVAQMDDRMLMLKSQRDKLVELMEKQKIRKVPDNWYSIEPHLKVLRIPEEELKSFLDETQVKSLQKLVEPYRNMEAQIP